MQIPVLKKIVINQGLGMAVADKKIIEVAINELTAITGQKAVATVSRKDIANFKLRKKMPIGVMVTLRRERMYEFLEKLVRVALPRIRDFKGIESKFDGRGNYTLGIQEQIIFPEINIDSITRILGMNITFVTSVLTHTRRRYSFKFFDCVNFVNRIILQGNFNSSLRTIFYKLIIKDVAFFKKNLSDFFFQIRSGNFNNSVLCTNRVPQPR